MTTTTTTTIETPADLPEGGGWCHGCHEARAIQPGHFLCSAPVPGYEPGELGPLGWTAVAIDRERLIIAAIERAVTASLALPGLADKRAAAWRALSPAEAGEARIRLGREVRGLAPKLESEKIEKCVYVSETERAARHVRAAAWAALTPGERGEVRRRLGWEAAE